MRASRIAVQARAWPGALNLDGRRIAGVICLRARRCRQGGVRGVKGRGKKWGRKHMDLTSSGTFSTAAGA